MRACNGIRGERERETGASGCTTIQASVMGVLDAAYETWVRSCGKKQLLDSLRKLISLSKRSLVLGYDIDFLPLAIYLGAPAMTNASSHGSVRKCEKSSQRVIACLLAHSDPAINPNRAVQDTTPPNVIATGRQSV